MSRQPAQLLPLLVPGLLAATALAGPPDLTKGEAIPNNADHDWTLGATGARGWIYSEKLVTTDARQIAITKVEPGSPADGVLAVGDVILGVGRKPFSGDPRIQLGRALTKAETRAGQGKLTMLRWRKGKTKRVSLRLDVLGSYGDQAPYECSKSEQILERGCRALAARIQDPRYRPNPISRSLNALALLASGEQRYLPLVEREARWAADFKTGGYKTWFYGYVTLFLAEYVLATEDQAVLPGLRRLALAAARGQSKAGSWGHRFANAKGQLGGYGMMNSPGIPLTLGLALATEAGVDDREVAEAVERSAKLIRFYAGKGAVPYGDHDPWIQTHEDNGKCGMATVLFDVLGEPEVASFFARMSLAAHGSARDTGHTGNFFNLLWAMPGVSRCGSDATGAWVEEYGAWYFDLARRWDGTFQHQGAPEPGKDKYYGWDATGAYLLAYAMPRRRTRLTGRQASSVEPLEAKEIEAVVAAGRGWTNADRHSYYDGLSEAELLQALRSWSPVVRDRAAIALGRRRYGNVKSLVRLLEAPALAGRLGACRALGQLGGRAAPAVAALQATLGADGPEELWLRVEAAKALAKIGKPAQAAVPGLLRLIAKEPAPTDPRAMEQRYVSMALFSRRGLLARSLDGVDREALYAAVKAGLANENGSGRSAFTSVYRNLRFEELQPLLPVILEATLEPAPSGVMFADPIRLEGLRVLSKHRVAEGIAAGVRYLREQNPWASEKRTPQILELLLAYGAHAQEVIPELTDVADYFATGEKNFPKKLSLQKAEAVRAAIETIQATSERPELRTIE